jgi:hypothetical protein
VAAIHLAAYQSTDSPDRESAAKPNHGSAEQIPEQRNGIGPQESNRLVIEVLRHDISLAEFDLAASGVARFAGISVGSTERSGKAFPDTKFLGSILWGKADGFCLSRFHCGRKRQGSERRS